MRAAAVLTPVLLSGLLAACGGGDGPDATASSSSTPPTSAAEESAPDLASGLLPADAFGPDAQVVAVTADQLSQAAGMAADPDAEITPKDCSAAVLGTQPVFQDFEDVAGQVASVGYSITVEVLVRGGPVDGLVGQLADAPARCPSARITSPQFGEASLTFESLPGPDLGDGSTMLRYTTSLTLPDGQPATVPTLVGAVQDGDRLLLLTNVDSGAAGAAPGAPPAEPLTPEAFAALLQEAYEVQAAALD